MPLRIDKTKAIALLHVEAAKAKAGDVDKTWVEKIKPPLSQLCEDGTSITHIAFLGTVVLAKRWIAPPISSP